MVSRLEMPRQGSHRVDVPGNIGTNKAYFHWYGGNKPCHFNGRPVFVPTVVYAVRISRGKIRARDVQSGWIVQHRAQINLSTGTGVDFQ